MGADKPFPPLLPDREEYVVEYNGVDDPLHAQNWPMNKKIYIGAILAFDAIAVSMGSSIFSSAIRPVAQEYGVIPEVTTLGTSMYVFGYAFGPLVSKIPAAPVIRDKQGHVFQRGDALLFCKSGPHVIGVHY